MIHITSCNDVLQLSINCRVNERVLMTSSASFSWFCLYHHFKSFRRFHSIQHCIVDCSINFHDIDGFYCNLLMSIMNSTEYRHASSLRHHHVCQTSCGFPFIIYFNISLNKCRDCMKNINRKFFSLSWYLRRWVWDDLSIFWFYLSERRSRCDR